MRRFCLFLAWGCGPRPLPGSTWLVQADLPTGETITEVGGGSMLVPGDTAVWYAEAAGCQPAWSARQDLVSDLWAEHRPHELAFMLAASDETAYWEPTNFPPLIWWEADTPWQLSHAETRLIEATEHGPTIRIDGRYCELGDTTLACTDDSPRGAAEIRLRGGGTATPEIVESSPYVQEGSSEHLCWTSYNRGPL